MVMVGLPYPNPRDPELRERMAFMDGAAPRPSPAAAPASASPGQQYYSDLCMKVSTLTSTLYWFDVQYIATLTEAFFHCYQPKAHQFLFCPARLCTETWLQAESNSCLTPITTSHIWLITTSLLRVQRRL